MCRMLGFSFKDKQNVNDLFKNLQDMAQFGIKSPHPHGAGIFAVNGNEILYHKWEKPIFDLKICLPEFEIGIMHARKASPNFPITYLQLHPFIDEKGKAFCHNGTIYTANRQNIFKSDSFDYFVSIKDFETIKELIQNIQKFRAGHKYTGINFLMTFDKKLFAYCDYKEDPVYYTMWFSEKGVVSSEKLNDFFIPMKKGELIIFERGKIVFDEII
ncbi:hypothetical protein JYK00_07050 [Thermosipho ferrireducens]|uniref:Glutamine amidotransferase type-2 domain-containing protein n=1 Tax=Thermosipho ferrireducens TaxID=2571116 RepID=A0ABX7S798_9BACT|nr:hypothetical protein [Thermosipho ferrireducens]QTA37487.1 hypothetical protein JYK00_07050 [Thermosipho ferrireducens]